MESNNENNKFKFVAIKIDNLSYWLWFSEFVVIKVNSSNHWLWFRTKNVTEKDGRFIGVDGRDFNQTAVDVNIDVNKIKERRYSNSLNNLEE